MAESKRTEPEPAGASAKKPSNASAPQVAGGFVTAYPDLSGRVIGDFCLLRKLGRGGMAEVYLAEQSSLRRQVAIKIMRPEFVTDPQYVKRFRHEASAAGGLNHPNIVQVYMVGEQDGIHFISQEYVQGRNLKEFITRKGPLEVPLVLHILKQVCAALQVAHEKGIVHRDIKPENILLTRKGEAKVADFGLAQLTLGGEKVSLTQEGVTMGTPLYMSPEQVHGKTLDARSDLYSLGVMAWHMLVGHPPFSGDTALAVAVKHLNEEPPQLSEMRPDVPIGVRMLIERMMSKKRENRPDDAQTVQSETRQLLRQLAGKDAPSLDAAFRPGKAGLSSSTGRVFHIPMGRHLIWLIPVCVLVAASSAGIGWAMRVPDPFKTKAIKSSRIADLGTVERQFHYAQDHPYDDEAWQAVKAKINEAGDSTYSRMRDQCDLNLAMIALHNRRIEPALQMFAEFADSTDPWKRAHGMAGLAIVEDLQGARANRTTIRENVQRAEDLARQLGRDSHLEPAVDAALKDVARRNDPRAR